MAIHPHIYTLLDNNRQLGHCQKAILYVRVWCNGRVYCRYRVSIGKLLDSRCTSWASQATVRAVDWPRPAQFYVFTFDFWHDVDHVDYAPTNKLTAHLYVRSKRDDRNNYPRIYKIDHKMFWKNEVKRPAFSLFAHVHVVLLIIRGWNFRSKTANWEEHRRFVIFPIIFVVITWLTYGIEFWEYLLTGGELDKENYIDVPLVCSAFRPPNFTLVGNDDFHSN